MPEELKEVYQEINHVEAFASVSLTSHPESVRTEYARRTYRTSPFDQGTKMHESFNKEIYVTKIHEFELQSLISASREGRQNYLGHRPRSERRKSID